MFFGTISKKALGNWIKIWFYKLDRKTPDFFVSHKFGQHLVQQLFLWEDEADEEEISKKGDDADHQDGQTNFGIHLTEGADVTKKEIEELWTWFSM